MEITDEGLGMVGRDLGNKHSSLLTFSSNYCSHQVIQLH